MTKNEWLGWLSSQNLTLSDNIITAVEGSAVESSAVNNAGAATTRLTVLGHLRQLIFTGQENRKFLQGQLTCDVEALQQDHNALGACCTPKGRMLANFRILAHQDDLILSLPACQSEALKAHLAKYAMFFRTLTITDCSDSYVVLGLSGPDAARQVTELTGNPAPTAGQTEQFQQGMVLSASPERFELWLNPDQAKALWQKLAEQCQVVPTADWQLQELQAGLAWVTAETRETYIPQHLNWQAVDGISFTKGCYTGQEIVARMRYLGKLKSRLYRFEAQTDSPPAVGTPVITAEGKKSGEVVTALPDPVSGHAELLAVVRNEDAASPLTLEDGTALALKSLPYPVE